MKLIQSILSKPIIIAVLIFTSIPLISIKAQYFGRNKVNYNDFNFKILHTKHFNIYYYKEEKAAVKYAAEIAERWYTRHSIILQDTLKGKQTLILYDGFPQFSQTNVTQGMIGQGTGGFTEPLLRRIVLPFAGPLAETNHVIGHELVHAFQFDITGKNQKNENGLPAASNMPLWFIEGMAEYFSLGPEDPFTAMWMREAALKKIPDISDLTNPKYFPYRYGQSLLAFIGGKYGDEKIGELLRSAATTRSIKQSIDSVLSISQDSLSKEWHAALHAQYDSLAKVTKRPGDYGKELITGKNEEGSLNVSPSLSPNGKKLVFFSSRDLFSIDLYLADAKTGKIEKNILKTEFNTHLENLEFINSAGAWTPDGKEFAFSAVAKGRPVLSLLDIKSGEIKKEIHFPKLAQIFTPTFSPDGRYVVFSALANGLSNLFVYDLKTDSLRHLTNDAYAELQPEFSPDGKNIAFVTDRFTSQLSDVNIGNYELALFNFNTGEIKKIPSFSDGKNINPQWSPNGKSIYFISNHHGISDIYRLDISDNQIEQVTNLYGGVSGITALSPALSVARDSNKMIFSVYQNNKYDIYSFDSTKIIQGKIPYNNYTFTNPGFLPPMKRKSPMFMANLDDPVIGLPSDTAYKITNYHPSLSIVGVGQPSVAAGVDPFGTYLGGGIALFWSDILGNHNMATALQVQSGNGITNISGLVGYMNSSHRLNWGGVIQQIPYYLTGYIQGYTTIDSTPAYEEQQYIYQETNREVSGILSYPFSQVFRVQLNFGFRNISFTNKVLTRAVSLNDGSVLRNETKDLGHQPSMNLGSVSAALVYDNSYMGATGPLLGQRYRLEITPYFGTISLFNILADYRKYIMPVKPFTLAGRILQVGRYGSGAEDSRLSPMYLGYPGLVRGYETSSFNSNEYSVFEKLIGSKMLIANFELRFPLLGAFGIGDGFYGYFPIDFAAFYDAGLAWTNQEKPWFAGGTRKPVSSTGVALRVNLFGYAVGEVDYVHPFNRPGIGWLWQFDITQGF